jgi:membrane-associated phospholipid phosphatase
VAAGSAAVFLALAAVFWTGTNTQGDDAADPLWTRIADVLGGPTFLPAAVLALIAALLLAGRWLEARFLAVAVVGAGLAMYTARVVLQAVGADDDDGRLSDFPSGHAAAATAFAGALTVLGWARWSNVWARVALAGVGAAVVVAAGSARIEAGDHTLLDIVGGVALGVGWLALSLLVAPPAAESPLGRTSFLCSVIAVGLTGFLLLAALYEQEPLTSVDLEAAERVAASAPPWLEALARPFSWLGGWIGLTALGVTMGVVLLRRRAWLDLAFFLSAFLGSQLAVSLLKTGFDRPRPHAGSAVPLPESSSFPSAHATAGAASLGALAVLVSERLPSSGARAWLWAVTLALGAGVGLSRIVLNVHFVTDVVAGWCFGAAWLAACLLVRDAIRSRRTPSAG